MPASKRGARHSRIKNKREDVTSSMAGTSMPAGAIPFAMNLRFPGQYFDAESRLHYNYFRDYDPTIGRYTESDPIGLSGGLNTYSYIRGTPLSAVDVRGLAEAAPSPTSWCRQNPVDCVVILGGGSALSMPKPTTKPETATKKRCRTCIEDYPEYDLCFEISDRYPYESEKQALLSFPGGVPGKPQIATDGVCSKKGTHRTVKLGNGQYLGSVFSCKCCRDGASGASLHEKWANNYGR